MSTTPIYFSIIIPTLNEQKALPLLLLDLADQSNQNFEILKKHKETLVIQQNNRIYELSCLLVASVGTVKKVQLANHNVLIYS